ncbi:MAG: hypothetical protein R6U11_00330, partial [Bacteroidales bacterium]
ERSRYSLHSYLLPSASADGQPSIVDIWALAPSEPPLQPCFSLILFCHCHKKVLQKKSRQNESHRALEKRRKSRQSWINLFTGFTAVFQFTAPRLGVLPLPPHVFYYAVLEIFSWILSY